MRIVFVIKSLNKCGGIERVTSLIANALVERGHDIHIVSFVGANQTPFFTIDERIKTYYLAPKKDRCPIIIRDIRRIVKLHKLFSQISPDIIIQEGVLGAISTIPAAKGYKVIGCEHASMEHHRLVPITLLSRLFFARCANKVVTLTKHDAEKYVERFLAKNIITIPNPVVLYPPMVSNLQEKIVLSVGRLSAVKGFDMLLTAWRKLQHKGWKLRIVGNGSWHGRLLKQIERQKIENVELLPATEAISEQYSRASIYVCSSRTEAFSLTIAEAMSAGLPVVSFNCGAGPRELITNRETGLIVPKNDYVTLSEAIEELMDNPALLTKMGKAALEHSERYQLNNIIGYWEELLKEVSEQ